MQTFVCILFGGYCQVGGILTVNSEKRTNQLFTMISYFLGVSSFEIGKNVSILLLIV